MSTKDSLFQRVSYFRLSTCHQLTPTDGRRGGVRKYLVSKFSQNTGGDLIICRAIFHDPSIYPEPEVFKPERFLNPDGSLRDDPLSSSAFGYGKRICPGRHFVDATLFIFVACILSVFRIENVQGDQEKQREYKYTGTILRWILFLTRIVGNKTADSFLVVRNHSHVRSFLGMKRQKS